MRVLYIGPSTETLVNCKQYEVLHKARSLMGLKMYIIKDGLGQSIAYDASNFLCVEEAQPMKVEEENLPLLELISRTQRNLDRIEIMVRKESR